MCGEFLCALLNLLILITRPHSVFVLCGTILNQLMSVECRYFRAEIYCLALLTCYETSRKHRGKPNFHFPLCTRAGEGLLCKGGVGFQEAEQSHMGQL